jgi:sugar/nucleoside kinase (ribokinase family)
MTAAINLRKLGVESTLVGRVGADMFGDYLTGCLEKAGVKTHGIKSDDRAQTSASVLMIDEKTGERSFFHCEGANSVFSIDDIDFDIILENDIVFVTGSFLLKTFDGRQTMEFLKKCKLMGKTTALDVCWDASGQWGETLDKVMPYIDIFLPSIDEARMIAKKDTPEEMAEVFLQKGVKTVVIKCGSDGCYVRDGIKAEGVMIPAFKLENVMDTVGAGDSFCSGFLAAYARSQSVLDCAKFGNATGAHCCMAKGATDGIKTFDEIQKFILERNV